MSDTEAVAQLGQIRDRIYGEVGQVVIGQKPDRRGTAHRLARRRPLPARRRTWLGQNYAHPNPRPHARSLLWPNPIHPGSDALGHHRHRGARRGHRHRPQGISLHPRAPVCQRHPRRRNQPHAPQDPSGPAPSHAGTRSHRSRRDHAAQRAILRARHPKPHRARGDLPPAPKPSSTALSSNCGSNIQATARKRTSSRATTSVAQATVRQVVDAQQIIELQQLVRRVPVADHCVRYAVSLVRSSRPGDAQAPDYIREMVSWGAGPRASQYLGLGGQGAGHPRRPALGRHRGYPRRGPAGDASPHGRQLPRRSAKHQCSRPDPASARRRGARILT